ncbi:hypothetical protein FACS1894216_10490 [Synergistales bacterium]|nr:hypothetical protein FACS1894216_10490 [Synergistales bacterium]
MPKGPFKSFGTRTVNGGAVSIVYSFSGNDGIAETYIALCLGMPCAVMLLVTKNRLMYNPTAIPIPHKHKNTNLDRLLCHSAEMFIFLYFSGAKNAVTMASDDQNRELAKRILGALMNQ